MNEFTLLFRGSNRAAPPDQRQKTLQRWGAWMTDLNARGVITNPGQPLEGSGKLVKGPGKVVTDGPFAEVKDVVNGFIVVQAPDIDAAAEIAKGCPALDDGGSVEVRPVLRVNT